MFFFIFLCNTGEKTHQLDIFFFNRAYVHFYICEFLILPNMFGQIWNTRILFSKSFNVSDESFYLGFFFFYTLWNLKFTYNSKCWMADEMKMLQLILVHEHEIPTKKKWFRSNDLFFFSANALLVSTF